MIAACLKWVDRRPEIDSLTGAVRTDSRRAGASEADEAALEWALRSAHALSDEVVAVTAGPSAADALLRDALAVGADHAVRVDLDVDNPSEMVAAALVPHLSGCRLVWCGDVSVDRGSGAVPAYLAARSGTAQALGLVAVDLDADGSLRGLRRLDGGRRERLLLTPPIVCSVEGAAARLRRASLAAALSARTAAIEVDDGLHPVEVPHRSVRPFRPRARTLPPPVGTTALARIGALTATPASAGHGPPMVLDPDAAAERILEALRTWGYVDG